MPLTLEELQEIQANAMADDLEIDFEKMSLWSKEDATAFFESGGEVEPGATPAAPPAAAQLPLPNAEDLKKWFPKMIKQDKPKFRIVCFHNAGSAESVYTGRGMRQPEDNPFVKHVAAKGGELLACELPGRESRRNEPRHTKLAAYCQDLYHVLAPLLQQDIPYVLIGHSMGTWFSYEWMRLLAEKGIPFPKQWVVSGFPAPTIPESERPWNKNAPMADPAFMDECRGWDVNEIVFQASNWKTFSPMMRDDFTLFDSYEYVPPPAHLPKGEFPVPIQAKYLAKDQRCKEKHLQMWKNLTSEKLSFTCTQLEGNHLFFYDVPARLKWMDDVIAKMPDMFK